MTFDEMLEQVITLLNAKGGYRLVPSSDASTSVMTTSKT